MDSTHTASTTSGKRSNQSEILVGILLGTTDQLGGSIIRAFGW